MSRFCQKPALLTYTFSQLYVGLYLPRQCSSIILTALTWVLLWINCLTSSCRLNILTQTRLLLWREISVRPIWRKRCRSSYSRSHVQLGMVERLTIVIIWLLLYNQPSKGVYKQHLKYAKQNVRKNCVTVVNVYGGHTSRLFWLHILGSFKQATTDIHESTETVSDYVTFCYGHCVTNKILTSYPNDKPWFSIYIKH